MTINIELRPEEEQALLERADGCGHELSAYVRLVLREHLQNSGAERRRGDAPCGVPPTLDELIDWEAIASCAREADDSVTLAEVRAATSKIRDSMARVVIEDERAERF